MRKTFHLALSLLVIVAGLSLGACSDATAKRILDGANVAQEAAAATYDEAAVKLKAADVACARSFTPTEPRPIGPEEKDAVCAAKGHPIPFRSTSLQKAAAPINASFDVVRRATAIREGVKAKPPTADRSALTAVLTELAGLVVEVVTDMTSAGVAVPAKLSEWTEAYKATGAH